MAARKLKPKENVLYNCGVVGVSHYYMAQSLSGVEKQHHLSKSIENLEAAERAGDKTTDHFKFLGDALLQHASETNDLSEYLRAVDRLKQAYAQDPPNTNIIASLARGHLNVGICKIRNGQDWGIDHVEEAIRLYDLLETAEGLKTYPDASIWGRRGQARLQLWYSSKRDPNERDPKLLDRAIEDFQATRTEDSPFLWQHSLANALLERYLLFEDISDLQEAKDLNDQNHSADNRDESHLKQRGRIYLTWAKNFADKEAYNIALESFQNCLPSEDPEIQYYIGLVLANRGIQYSHEDDLREAIKWLEISPDLSDRKESTIGLLPKVYQKLARKIDQEQPKEALSLLDKTIGLLQEKLNRSELLSNEELAEYHDILGSNYHDRYKVSGLPEDIQHAVNHLWQAYELGMQDPMFLSRLGYACLQLGKIIDNAEDQGDLFEDAIKYLELSKSEGNEDASNYSELGEAYLRLYQIQKGRRMLKKALDMFLESLDRGNDSLENMGLIGDCYYRLSHFENCVANLVKALEFKTKAREAGHESKEHFSVVGRIHLSLYGNIGGRNHFMNGVKSICEAGCKDKTWPWPVCQLAEVTEQFPEMVQQLESEGQVEESFYYPDDRIWRLFLENQSEELWLEGAELAASWSEVEKNILGGKSKVYIAEDPHRLILATFVFKPGDPIGRLPNGGLQRLREEQQRVVEMNQYLEQIGAKKFLVPISIGIFALGKTKLYAMRRAIGQNLSGFTLHGPRPDCEQVIQDTIEFLALYHTWHTVPQGNKEQVIEINRNSVLNRLRQVIEDIGLPVSLVYKIMKIIEPIFEIMRQLPLVEKKDAHPDNWIITDEGKIVMIDLEKPKPQSQFILSELVQLIEDLPFLPWDQEGWQRRKALMREYLKHYNKFLEPRSISTISIPPGLQIASYLSFTIWRALWGIGFASAKEQRKGITPSSELRWEKRKDHYFKL
ncbi:MAG: hypothetical protein H8E40_16665, partial [Chloroflexi bacterium]|nr:hypothetical protein [Chloroflexota bacterium]